MNSDSTASRKITGFTLNPGHDFRLQLHRSERNCMRKFFEKPWFLVLFLLFVFALAALLSEKYPRYEKHTDDYPVIYADKLEEIFGRYSLGPLREDHMESEDGRLVRDSCEWQISYCDSCGREIECTLNNYETLPVQQLRWLQKQLEEYFRSKYVVTFFDGLIQQEEYKKTYCFCRIGRICSAWSTGIPESRSDLEICSAFEARLKESEPPIPLYKLSYADILDRYPVSLTVQITLKDSVYSQSFWKQKAGRQLQLMASEMTKDFGGVLNLNARISRPSFEDEETIRYTCVMGQEVEMDFLDFEHAVFEAYKGKYW